MPILDPAMLDGIDRPELIFAFVAPVGAPLPHLARVLASQLNEFGYLAEEIRLSTLLETFNLPTPPSPAGASDYDRIDTLMTRGNELRQRTDGGEALALSQVQIVV